MTEPIALDHGGDTASRQEATTSLDEALARVGALEARCEELRQERERAFVLLLKAQQELSERAADDVPIGLDSSILERAASARADLLQRTVDQMQQSSSWRITRPWRALGRFVHRLLGR